MSSDDEEDDGGDSFDAPGGQAQLRLQKLRQHSERKMWTARGGHRVLIF